MRITFLLLLTLSSVVWAADSRKGNAPVEVSSLEELKIKSAQLGRPAAVLYLDTVSTCPLHNGQCSRWLGSPALGNYVILKVDWKAKNAESDVVNKLRSDSNNKAGNMIPMLFLVDESLSYKDVIPYNQDEAVATKVIEKQAADYGVILSEADVSVVEKELARVAPLLAESKTDNARTILKKVKPLATQAPKAGFAKSYSEAVSAFNQHIIAECDTLLKPMASMSADERLKKVTPLLKKYKDLLSEGTTAAITTAAGKSQ